MTFSRSLYPFLFFLFSSFSHLYNSRVSDQYGVFRLHIIVEIYHSGRTPSNRTLRLSVVTKTKNKKQKNKKTKQKKQTNQQQQTNNKNKKTNKHKKNHTLRGSVFAPSISLQKKSVHRFVVVAVVVVVVGVVAVIAFSICEWGWTLCGSAGLAHIKTDYMRITNIK